MAPISSPLLASGRPAPGRPAPGTVAVSRPLPRRPARRLTDSRRADSRRAGRPRRRLALALLSLLCLLGWRCAAARSPASESLASATVQAGAGIFDGGGTTALPSPRPDAALQALVEGAIDPANGTT
ncbi:MAG: hypothetical protein M3442_12835, partial [Chloroflexota bacterium]|nr:hypothetical protein [Chloroflexota bacterium]